MSGSLQGSEGQPNLTPMLDMVFQLITFFMLVINFKSAAIYKDLNLPVIGSARPVDTGEQGIELLILNIDKEGRLMIYKQPRDIDSYIAKEAQASKLAARRKNPNFDPETSELPTRVVIRADQLTPFKLVNRVLRACQDNGYRSFALMAMNKPTARRR